MCYMVQKKSSTCAVFLSICYGPRSLTQHFEFCCGVKILSFAQGVVFKFKFCAV